MLSALFAQDAGGGAVGQGQVPPFWANPMFLLAMIVLFWVVVILPMSRRQKKEQSQMMASLKRGTKVLTASGIVGTIVTIKDGDDELVIRSEDARIRIKRSTVQMVIGTDEAEANK
ncbi:preprotein translocase subunit YajC [bacterium]|nr:preprotein translocase subunit YajC [bacterium]